MRKRFLIALTAVFALLLCSPTQSYAEQSVVDPVVPSFVYIAEPTLQTGDRQDIAVGIGDLPYEVVGLIISNVNTGETFQLDVSASVDGAVAFASDALSAGSYSLVGLACSTDVTLPFTDDIQGTAFEVGSSSISAYSLDNSDDVDTKYIGSNESEENDLSSVLASYSAVGRAANKTIVLDPGHGGYDSGAVGYGLQEKLLTLKIAQACRDELGQYNGVRVVMTRDSDTSVSGSTSARVELQARCDIANNFGAALFVSFHINSGGGSGVEVWIPRDCSWYSSFNDIGESLGRDVLERLVGLGLANRGTKSDYYSDNGKELYYPDGSHADSLAVIRHCREYGIPAVLIEHGFIDNSHDAGLLSSDSYLERLGKADAQAIAKQLNLVKTSVSLNVDRNTKGFTLNAAFSGESPSNVAYRLQTPSGSVSWAQAYEANDGTWTADIAPDEAGVYSVEVYANLSGVNYSLLSEKIGYDKADVEVNALADVVSVKTFNWAAAPSNVAFQFVDGLGNTAWIQAEDENGTWSASPAYADLPSQFGTMTVNVWVSLDGVPAFKCASANYSAARPDVSLSCSVSSGTITARATGFSSQPSNAAMCVRGPSGASRWYQAHRQPDGSWTADVPASADFGEFGMYRIELWCAYFGTNFNMASCVANLTGSGYLIMGPNNVTVSQLVGCFDKYATFPGAAYASYGASNATEFCTILVEEAEAEGVKPEVVFAQAMLETGWLRFGGQVKAYQCNFCGLGATDGGAAGADFSGYGADAVRMGLRAQVQHLKAYASTQPLEHACVDPRFTYVTRGIAPAIDDLSGRWATTPDYGGRIYSIIRQL